MVLNTTTPRGATDNPERVFASPARWAVQVLFSVMALAGLGAIYAGFFVSLDDGTSGVPFVVFGVSLAAFAASAAEVQAPPRRSLVFRPAVASGRSTDIGSQGVRLPLRPVVRVAPVVAMTTVVVMGVVLAVVGSGVVGGSASRAMVAAGAAMAVVGAGFASMSIRSTRRGSAAVVLDPTGVTFPAGTTPRTHVAWGELTDVAVVGGWQPRLVIAWRDANRSPRLAGCRLLSQAWPPSTLIRVLDFYRTHPADRAALTGSTGPDALERLVATRRDPS